MNTLIQCKILAVGIFCCVMWPLNLLAAANDDATAASDTNITEVVRINNLESITVPEFEPDAGVNAVFDNFCIYSNDNNNSYPVADIVADESTHSANMGVVMTSSISNLKFDMTIISMKLKLDGESGTQDKHVLDYVASVKPLAGSEPNSTDCATDNYQLVIDINDDDAKEAMAGTYSTSVMITLEVRN